MPLTPNGKVDKPALPFPDTAVAASSSKGGDAKSSQKLSPTELTIHDIWLRLLPSPPPHLPLDESFFDLGGHSILATRLIFEIRKALVVNAPLGLVFDHPTIGALAHHVDLLRQSDYALPTSAPQTKANGDAQPAEEGAYAKDAEELSKQLKPAYASPSVQPGGPRTVFLTGATGFLGAYIVRDLLTRPKEVGKLVCLVRAGDKKKAIDRLRESGEARNAWDEAWVEKGALDAVVGDLESPKFGLSEADWTSLTAEADSILHNGAFVSSLLQLSGVFCFLICADAARG
jgi:L-aminoadipate-semialdehyde dehydrogenase